MRLSVYTCYCWAAHLFTLTYLKYPHYAPNVLCLFSSVSAVLIVICVMRQINSPTNLWARLKPYSHSYHARKNGVVSVLCSKCGFEDGFWRLKMDSGAGVSKPFASFRVICSRTSYIAYDVFHHLRTNRLHAGDKEYQRLIKGLQPP